MYTKTLRIYQNIFKCMQKFHYLSVNRSSNVSGQNDKLCSRLKFFRRRNNKKGNQLDEKNVKALSEEIITLISKDPFLSPYIASDDMLAHLPPIKILVFLYYIFTVFFVKFLFYFILFF